MKKLILLAFLVLLFSVAPLFAATEINNQRAAVQESIEGLLGEQLSYDVSFLWFDRLGEGTIRLTRGDEPGTYLAVLEARTRGFAAFVTKNRIEKFQTLMEIGPDGLLRPLVHSTHSLKGKGSEQREKVTSYRFDYENQQVKFQKLKNHVIHADEMIPLQTDGPVYDILSAFYNVRSGAYGPLGEQQISLPTLHRKGVEEIVVAPAHRQQLNDQTFFGQDEILCTVLVDPEVFKTNGSELLIGFDKDGQPQRAVVQNVIGLGDVKGVLRYATPPLQASN